MKDKELQQIIENQLNKLERTIDCWGDTPKRREASEKIVQIRKLIKETPSEGYE